MSVAMHWDALDSENGESLYDVLDKSIEHSSQGAVCEYEGFHIIPQGNGTYNVQYDGHIGRVMQIDPAEYDDVLSLVRDLNDCLHERFHYDYQDDKEGLVEWAGKIVTHDRQQAEEEPNLYIWVPEEPPEAIDE